MSKVRSTSNFVSGHRIKIVNFIQDVKAYKAPVKKKLNSQSSEGIKKHQSQESLCEQESTAALYELFDLFYSSSSGTFLFS